MVTVDFFDAQESGRFAGNAHWITIVQDRLHKLVVRPSKGKAHLTRVQYDKRFPQVRRVTLSYEGSKTVAMGVLNDKVWRAFGWRRAQETMMIKDVVVENIEGKQGEYAADRAASIARESGLTLARRSPRWLTHGTSGRMHFGKARLALRFSIISTAVPSTVRDKGLVIGTVYEYVRDHPDRAHYTEVLGYRVTVVPPQCYGGPINL